MLPYKRHDRLEEMLHHEISKIVQGLKDPELGFVTVTGIKLSSTFREAKVFYSVLGTEEDKIRAKEILENSIYHIRHEIGRLKLRYIPTLQFVYDDTPEKASRVFQLLGQIQQEQQKDALPAKNTKSKKK